MILNRDFKSISCRRQSQKFHKEKNKPINNNRFHNTMKKSFMILAVLAMSALAMVSCKKDKDTDNGEKITIYATMDSPKAGGEKTHLGPTTNNFTPTYWSLYDEVAVFSGNQMKEFELTGGENTPDATFAGEAPTSNSAYCAFYPYSGPNNLSATQSGSTYTVTYALPYCQTYRAPINGVPTFDDRDCPMIAYSTDGQNYQFKNMMGVLKLDLKGTGVVDHIVLTDNNTNAKLHGTATVSVSVPGATPELTSASITDGGNDLKLTCGDGVELNENTATSFYFVVPVGTLGTNGFIIDVYNANDEKYTIDKSNISGNIIQRAIISTLAVDNVEVPEAGFQGLCLTAEDDGLEIWVRRGYIDVTLEYSYTGEEPWTEYTPNAMAAAPVIINLNQGDKLYFRGNNPNGLNQMQIWTNDNKKMAASGNIMSLVDPTCQSKIIPGEECFNGLFMRCSGLTSAPELPATTLSVGCYRYMFMNCGQLRSAPELPATVLAESCYQSMFINSGLTSAPTLPATTMAKSCYSGMFSGCQALVQAPVLPATTLADGCYNAMFDGCSNLNEIEVHFTDWRIRENDYGETEAMSTSNWTHGVSSSNGVFRCPYGLEEIHYVEIMPGLPMYDYCGIPENWTIVRIP